MTALTHYEQPDPLSLGKVLAQSGYFQDAKDAAQAAVKVLAGQEMGIGAIAAMTGIYIVKGRVTLSANLMAAQIKRSGKYNYRITRHDDESCEIAFFEGGEEIGRSSFTADDAKKAGLWNSSDPWRKTPRNMLFSRAMSNGCKWYCPDIFAGPIYTPDELDAEPQQPIVVSEVRPQIAEQTEQATYDPLPDLVTQLKVRRGHAGAMGVALPTLKASHIATAEQVRALLSATRREMEITLNGLIDAATVAGQAVPDMGAPVDKLMDAQISSFAQKLTETLNAAAEPVPAGAADDLL